MKNPFYRKPDFYVGGQDNPYMLRWWVIPRNRLCNIYLHKFLRDDEDRAHHDHPWNSLSIILKGNYLEHRNLYVYKKCIGRKAHIYRIKPFKRWSFIYRNANYAHRIELSQDYQGNKSPVWTLFITGPKRREWGFHCPQGWRHWKDFVDEADNGNIGKGCGN